MYREEEQRRTAEEGFGGTRSTSWPGVTCACASLPPQDDLPRVAELAERTHQLNSTGRHVLLEKS